MNEQQEYEIEQILAAKFSSHRNRFFYLVKWVNWPVQDSTWEPQENFQNSKKLLEQFKDRHRRHDEVEFEWQEYQSLRQFWKPEYQRRLKSTRTTKNKPKTNPKYPQKITKQNKQNTKNKKIQKSPKQVRLQPGRRTKKNEKQIFIKQISDSSQNQEINNQIQSGPQNTQTQIAKDLKADVLNKIFYLLNQKNNEGHHINPSSLLNNQTKLISKKTVPKHQTQPAIQEQNQQSNKIKQTTKSLSSNPYEYKLSFEELSPQRQNSSSRKYESNSNYEMMYEEQGQADRNQSEQQSNRMDGDYVCQQQQQEEEDDDRNYQCEYKLKQKYNFINESKMSNNNNIFESPFHENEQSHLNHGIFDDIITNINLAIRRKKEQDSVSDQDQGQNNNTTQYKEKIPPVPSSTIPNQNIKTLDKNRTHQQIQNKSNPISQQSIPNNNPQLNETQTLIDKQKYKIMGIRRNTDPAANSRYLYLVVCKEDNNKKWMNQFEVFLNCPLSLVQYYEQKVNFNQSQPSRKVPTGSQ